MQDFLKQTNKKTAEVVEYNPQFYYIGGTLHMLSLNSITLITPLISRMEELAGTKTIWAGNSVSCIHPVHTRSVPCCVIFKQKLSKN